MKTLAQLKVPGYDKPIQAPSGIPTSNDTSVGEVISWIIIILFTVGIIASVIFLIWGGIRWITSAGDKQKIEKARATIIFAIIGLLVIVLSFAILSLIGKLLGIPYLSGFGGGTPPAINPCTQPGRPC